MREAAGSDRCPAQVLLQVRSQDLQQQHRLDACQNVSRLPCYIITPSQTVVSVSSVHLSLCHQARSSPVNMHHEDCTPHTCQDAGSRKTGRSNLQLMLSQAEQLALVCLGPSCV